jgi:two-component system, OmpR family, sensor kinase
MRRRLVWIAALTLTAALVPVTALFYLVLSRTLEGDAHRLLQARADAVSATIDLSGGRVSPRETSDDAALDASTWVFDPAGHLVEHPLQRSRADQVAQGLAHVRHPVRQDVGDLALLAVPLRGPGGRTGTVVASPSRLPYEHAERTALTAAISLDLVVLFSVAVLTWHTVSAALAPVARMTGSAGDWGAHDTGRRFSLGPVTDELTGLAATLDGLLARLSASLGHERRLTAEIAHELRTPISRIRAEAEVALRSRRTVRDLKQVLGDIVADADHLAGTIDALLQSAASHPDHSASTCSADEVIRQAVDQIATGAETFVIDESPPGLPELAVEHQQAVRALGPVLDNARKFATGRTSISVEQQAGSVVIAVLDDGPGFTPAEVEAVFQPGARGSAAAGTSGVGLGLPLARRLARAAGGDVTIDARHEPGARVELRLPAVPAEPVDPPVPVPRWPLWGSRG